MSADRLAKLRRMAEHPTSNPHEAAIAREEMERLEREHVPFANVPDCIFAAMGTNRQRYEAERAARWPGVDWPAIEQSERDKAERYRTGALTPGDGGYYEWARTLRPGTWVEVRSTLNYETRMAIVERMTATQYIMSDGSRFRRAGQYPGYKVGETGQNGRTYLVKAVVP